MSWIPCLSQYPLSIINDHKPRNFTQSINISLSFQTKSVFMLSHVSFYNTLIMILFFMYPNFILFAISRFLSDTSS